MKICIYFIYEYECWFNISIGIGSERWYQLLASDIGNFCICQFIIDILGNVIYFK